MIRWIDGFRILVGYDVRKNGISMDSRLYSRTLQFIVSPRIGSLSDKYGRKKILLLTMIGNILSALVYVQLRP
jgi:hypothetical protein